MNDYLIDIQQTIDFHRELADALPQHHRLYRASLDAANGAVREQRIVMGKNKQLNVALSALLLSDEANARVAAFTERMHELVESVLAATVETPGLLQEAFPDHERLFPFLQKTRGVDSRQVVSRYDLAIEPSGRLRVMELNTSCPGGFMIAEAVSIVTLRGLERLGFGLTVEEKHIGCVLQEDVVDAILAAEDSAQIEEGAVGVLNDENELSFELDLLAAAFRRRLRDVYFGDARKLELRDGRLYGDGRYISVVYNKFRISTPNSQNHCWREGFEERYQDLLHAQRDQQVVCINNLFGMGVAEDKALLALFHHPEITRRLSDDDQAFVDQHIPWTTRLLDQQVDYRGQSISLLQHLRDHREKFVIKPANEGRGFGVMVGRFATQQQWEEACVVDPDCPCIAQEFVETQELPVVCLSDRGVIAEKMFLTLGSAVIRGKYQGLISRVSASAVTNVAREGFLQAVFVGDSLRKEVKTPSRRVRVKSTRTKETARNSLRLDNSLRLHKRLAAMLPAQSGLLLAALERANRALPATSGGSTKNGVAAMRPDGVALSSLVLTSGDVQYLKRTAETFHELVERVLDHVLADSALRDRWFGSYSDLFPYFAKTPGSSHWQAISRYEAVVQPSGKLQFVNLSVGAPALLLGEGIAQETRRGFMQLSRASGLDALNIGSPGSLPLIDALLAMEKRAGAAPGLVAVLCDEANTAEANKLANAIETRGREAVVCKPEDLTYENQQLRCKCETDVSGPISLAYTHIALTSAGDELQAAQDFQAKRPLFEAQQQGQVVLVNNLITHTIASDPSFLAMFFDRDVNAHLLPAERAFVRDHLAWTSLLRSGEVSRGGRLIDLIPFILRNRKKFILKPITRRNPPELLVGQGHSKSGWETAVHEALQSPEAYVVQEFVPPYSLPVITEKQGQTINEQACLTLGLTVFDGAYSGVLSHTFAKTDGRQLGQAVFVVGEPH